MTKLKHDLDFQVNPRKVVEVLLWVAEKQEGSRLDLYKTLKTMFFADVYHLNRYGRPITGDYYVAMTYGPVASYAYDLLKGNPLATNALDEMPIERIDNISYRVTRKHNPDYLSESDVEALEYGWNTCKGHPFGAIRDISHEHPAYKNAWSKRITQADRMKFEDFFENNKSQEQFTDILEHANYLQL